MNKKVYLLVITCCFAFCVFAQQSTLVLVRPDSHFGSAARATIYVTDSVKRPVYLYNNSFFTTKFNADTIRLSEGKTRRKPLVVTVSPGQTVYGLVNVWPGFWSTTVELNLIDSQKAQGYLMNPKINNMAKPMLRPMMRVGVELGIGFGLNDFPALQTTDGGTSNLGYGGGLMYGLYIGNQFSKHFDLELSYRFATRGLTPHLENASIDFKRHMVHITPSFVIPIEGGYYQRLRVGGGLTMVFDPKQEFDLSQIPQGFKDTWIYENAIGYHASINYELNFSKQFSSLFGVRYSDVRYVFKQSATAMPIDQKLVKPNGNSIDIIMGLGFHF